MGRGTGKGDGKGKDGGYDGGIKLWPDGLAGISKDGIFGFVPAWVDEKLAPGHSSQIEQLGIFNSAKTVATLKHFFMSPNLVWWCIALALHIFVPYDFAAAKSGLAPGWILSRFAVNYTVAFVYYAFFFVFLYVIPSKSVRKFRENSFPTKGNMAHNMWYWSLAIVQWTWWEAVMVRLWATGAVPYVTMKEIGDSWTLLGLNVAWVLLIPVWRDLHFYIAHRFLHIRAVYTYVHKLHHRNADPEPFSGMTMHPIEHLYYFSNAFVPSLYLGCLSPVIFTWNFIHLTIAPGAGHSGFEDHFQADQYHYVHHAKFECNYGSPMSGWMDQYLGTFREKLGASKAYQGKWTEKDDDNLDALAAKKKKNDDDEGGADAAEVAKARTKTRTKPKPRVWSINGYLGMPASWDHAVYTAFWCSLFPLAWVAASRSATTLVNPAKIPSAHAVACIIAYSPVFVALLLSVLSGDRMSMRWPFHEEKVVGAFGFFVVLAWLACILPVYHATLWVSQLG